MLLRNLDVSFGLCNGTRLKVTSSKKNFQVDSMGRYTLGCRFISGPRKGDLVIIPRIDNYYDKNLPFKLRRRQYPIRPAFAMTINKSQGGTFSRVGVSLPDPVFSHGQLYVALSRVRASEGLKVVTSSETVKNVVYEEVFMY